VSITFDADCTATRVDVAALLSCFPATLKVLKIREEVTCDVRFSSSLWAEGIRRFQSLNVLHLEVDSRGASWTTALPQLAQNLTELKDLRIPSIIDVRRPDHSASKLSLRNFGKLETLTFVLKSDRLLHELTSKVLQESRVWIGDKTKFPPLLHFYRSEMFVFLFFFFFVIIERLFFCTNWGPHSHNRRPPRVGIDVGFLVTVSSVRGAFQALPSHQPAQPAVAVTPQLRLAYPLLNVFMEVLGVSKDWQEQLGQLADRNISSKSFLLKVRPIFCFLIFLKFFDSPRKISVKCCRIDVECQSNLNS
jgi:hypothetical protein